MGGFVTGAFWLDWAIMSVSLFNTILLLWLGLTVLLNAERRSWGIWLVGASLLMGGAFFVSHSAILGHNLYAVSQGINFWWRVGWVPVVVLPLAWYVVILWYAGFWSGRRTRLRHRHGPWFLFVVLLALGLAGLLALVSPLPSYGQAAQLDLSATPTVGGIPLLLLAYPFYIVLSISLSLDVLLFPGPSERMMGILARDRARPWLVAASVVLLLVGVLVAWFMFWVVFNARQRALYGLYTGMALTVGGFDLVIASLIGLSILLLGQAAVSYEVFTGTTLPRRGFFRHWRSGVLLAAGYGAIVGWSLALGLRPIYSLLLTTMLMVIFYALFGWRSFAERERYMDHLRPFVASQRLYEHLLAPGALSAAAAPGSSQVDVATLFGALCDNVLGARVAYLIAFSPLVPLGQPLLAYRDGRSLPLSSTADVAAQVDAWRSIAAQFGLPQTLCVPLEPARYGGAVWAVSLWGERGLIGVMLLGEKRDGGLYTHEEIEIARASGERLIDTQATAETARRLLALLRQRIAQIAVMEGQGRRVLHDEVLPQLHTAILNLGGLQGTPAVHEAVDALTGAHRRISDLMRDAPPAASHLLARQGLVAALRTMVHNEFEPGSNVEWRVPPEVVPAVEKLPLYAGEVVFFAAQELVRNAARHGRGADRRRPLHLRISLAAGDGLSLTVEDDGVGFSAGSVPRDPAPAGSSSGLQFHSTMLAAIGASLEVTAGPGTRATITLPQGALEMMAHEAYPF